MAAVARLATMFSKSHAHNHSNNCLSVLRSDRRTAWWRDRPKLWPSKQIGPHGSTLELDVGVTCRTMRDDVELIQANLKIIREYLLKSFPGFNMTEDTPDPNVCHRFTMTNGKTFQLFRLKVGWSRFSENYNNPERTNRSLTHGGVAGKMRSEKNGQYYYW